MCVKKKGMSSYGDWIEQAIKKQAEEREKAPKPVALQKKSITISYLQEPPKKKSRPRKDPLPEIRKILRSVDGALIFEDELSESGLKYQAEIHEQVRQEFEMYAHQTLTLIDRTESRFRLQGLRKTRKFSIPDEAYEWWDLNGVRL